MSRTFDGQLLLQLARSAIEERLGIKSELRFESFSWLEEKRATFVTLTKNHALRGCIGSLEPHVSLLEDIRKNAVAAAQHDPRFPPVTKEELSSIEIEVSLLSPLSEMHFSDEMDAKKKMRPHIDGIVFSVNHRRSTYLPQVWEQLPDPDRFLEHLKIKAGFPPDYWSPQVRLFRYTLEKWSETQASLSPHSP